MSRHVSTSTFCVGQSPRSLASSHRHPSIITMATRVSFHFLFSITTWRTSLMRMLSSIGSVFRFDEKIVRLGMHLFRRHDTGTSMHLIIATISSIPSREATSSFHSIRRWIFFPLKTPHFVAPSESFSAAWMSGIERWKICYEFPRDKRAYQDPQGTSVCPGGDNIVAELGSEMTKNGNIVSDSDSWSRIYRSHQLDRLPSWDHGHTVVQEGPGGLNLLFP